MPKAIRIQQTGAAEVMQYVDVEVGEPGQGQARIRHTAIGVNFIDTYHRSGLYPMPLPARGRQRGRGRGRGGRPRRDDAEKGRPGGLHRAGGLVLHRAPGRGGPHGEDPRGHQRRAGGLDDAQGHDRRST